MPLLYQCDSHLIENSALCLRPVLAGKADKVELQHPCSLQLLLSQHHDHRSVSQRKKHCSDTASLALLGCGGYVWRSGGAVGLVTLPKSAPSTSQNPIMGCNTRSPGSEQVPWGASEVNSVYKHVQTPARVSFVLFTACLQRLIKLNGEKLSQLDFFSHLLSVPVFSHPSRQVIRVTGRL